MLADFQRARLQEVVHVHPWDMNSTRKLTAGIPFDIPQIPSNRDHRALIELHWGV